MKTISLTVIITALQNEFMETVNALRLSMLEIGAIILLMALVIVYFVARAMVKPMRTAVNALKNLAQGEGDLTVRLPVHGNDEMTDMAEYFTKRSRRSAHPSGKSG